MANIELPDLKTTQLTPALVMGAASPLWSYFGAATAGGLAYWWMARLANPANLEALFGGATALPAPVEGLLEPMVEAVEATAEVVVAVCEAATDALTPEAPIGGESAPLSPMVADPEPDAVAVDAVAEQSAPVVAAPLSDLEPEAIPEPKIGAVATLDSALAPEGSDAADTVVEEPVARPPRVRVKKAPPIDEG